MFRRLCESAARMPRLRGAGVTSAAAHAALVAVGVAMTTAAPPGAAPPARSAERLLPTYVLYTTHVGAAPVPGTSGSAPHVAPRPRAPRGARATASGEAVPSTVPEVPDFDLGGLADPTSALAARAARLEAGLAFADGIVATGYDTLPRPAFGDVYRMLDADRLPIALAGNPRPKYPPFLAAANVVGEVLARYVIDATGRTDAASIEIVRSSHRQFARSVRDVIPRMRFAPAQLAGRPISVLAEQQFNFVVR